MAGHDRKKRIRHFDTLIINLIISKKLDGVVSLRFLESFNQEKWSEFDRTYKMGLIYKISDVYSFTTNFNHARGESQFDSIGLNFKVNF